MKILEGDEHEFKDSRNRTECSSFDTVWVLLHRTWVAEQSDFVDFSDTLVGRTPGEPFVHSQKLIDTLYFLRTHHLFNKLSLRVRHGGAAGSVYSEP